MNREEIEIQIWEYIDGACDEATSARIAGLINSDPEWERTYTGLRAIHAGIQSGALLEQPSMRFTKNVTDALAKEHIAPAAGKYINKIVIRGIATVFAVLLVTFFVYSLTSITDKGASSAYHFHFNMPGIFNSTLLTYLIPVNIILALVLIDSLVHKRMKKYLR